MQISEKQTSVLIVGAGPSGLMMAAQLLRYGIQPVIIDSNQGPTNHSKALAVQARSLEIYRQLSVVDKVLAEGKKAKGIVLNYDGEQKAKLLLSDVGKVDTPYPYVFMYPQNKNERQLLDYLTQNCCPVYWNTTLTELIPDERKVTITLQSGDNTHVMECDWIIGADGAHSRVRKHLNISFKGDTYKHLYYLIDGKLSQEFDEVVLRGYLSKKGIAFFFPMPDGYYRIIGSLPNWVVNEREPTLQEVVPWLKTITKTDVEIAECRWFTTYKLHHRMAQSFNVGRCFLIGDAAHIHSPVGGQGMNTGLQDAYNLAWKLAYVVNGKMDKTILNSYAAERMPVAKRLLNTTDRAFNIAMSNSFLVSIFKKYLMGRFLRSVWHSEKVRQEFFKTISQTIISYRDSKINLHLSNADNIKAGDRLPCLRVYDEKRQAETDLHEWCSKPGFTLIAMAKLNDMDLFNIARWITQNYQGVLNFFYLPPSKRNSNIFNAFEVKAGQKAIIVRPDMHIGFINDWVDIEKMDNYLRNVLRFQVS